MARYVVMEPPGTSENSGERALILRDGFHIVAFLVPPLWLLWNRLWIEAALTFAAMLALTWLGEAEGFGWTGSALSLLLSIYVGLEGAGMRIAALRRRDWDEWGALDADSLAEAEIRYAVGAADGAGIEVELPWQQPTHYSPRRSPRSTLGMVSYPRHS